MDIKALDGAVKGAILALTKLSQVMQDINDSLIQENNAGPYQRSSAGDTDATLTVPGVTVTTLTGTVDSSLEVESAVAPAVVEPTDSNGVTWDSRIHASTKTTKADGSWKSKRGVSPELVQQVLAEQKGTPAAELPSGLPGLPGTPAAPDTPAAPGMPVVAEPSAAEAAVVTRKKCVAIIKELDDAFGVSVEDCKEIFTEQFNAAQHDGELAFGSLTYDQFDEVLEYLTNLRDKYVECRDVISELYTTAGEANKATIDGGLTQIFSTHNTDQLAGVHYSELDPFGATLHAWLNQWKEWAAN